MNKSEANQRIEQMKRKCEKAGFECPNWNRLSLNQKLDHLEAFARIWNITL